MFAPLMALAATLVMTAAPRVHKPRALVMDFPADPSLAPSALAAINDYLSGSLRDQGFDVLTARDVAAALGLERQKQLLGCSESSCLAEIGGALGVDYIVRGTLAVLDRDITFSITIVDPDGRVLNQVRHRVEGHSSSDVVTALDAEVPRLVAFLRPQSSAAGGLEATAPPAEGVSAPSARSHTGAYVLMGVGAASLVASGVLYAMAKSSRDDAIALNKAGSSFDTQLDTARTRYDASLGALGLGVVAAGAGGTLFFVGSF